MFTFRTSYTGVSRIRALFLVDWSQSSLDTRFGFPEKKDQDNSLFSATPDSPSDLAKKAGVPRDIWWRAESTLAQNQGQENRNVVDQNQAMVENIQRGVPEKIDRLKTQVVLQEILEITDPNIIQTLEAGGIDRQKSFQHLVTVIASILRGGYAVPKTQKEWKNLGYRGEWVFGEKELNAVNAFFAQIKGNPQRENMVQYIAQARNKEDAYRDLLQGIRDKRLANMSQNDTGAIQYTEGKGLESNMDSKVDALIGGETLWSGIVSRDALEVAIKRALTVWKKDINQLYTEIVGGGEVPDWTNDRAIIAARMRFHDALTGRLVIMRALGGANAGLEAVLQGKDKKLLADIGDKDIKIELKDIKWLTPTQINLASGALGLVVAYASGGIVTLRAQGVETIKADSIFDELTKEKWITDRMRQWLEWAGNLFVGRRLALSLGNNRSHESLRNRIVAAAEILQKIDAKMESSKIENTTIRQAFEQAQNYGMFEEKDGTQKFQRAILEQVILAEGKSEQDTKNWWVSVNPFFLGAHRDSVKVRERATEVSQANLIEADTTRERIDLSTTGIKHREEGGKHIYTLPSTMKDLQGVITGDIPVRVNNNGKFESQTEVSFDMPQAVNIALVTNQDKPEYIVSFSDAKKNMNTATVTTSSNVDSQPVETKIERNGISQQLAGSIYLMSRNSEKYPSFDKALLQIADQDYGGALKILKGYNANVARQLVALYKDKPEELATVLTYTYGSIRRIDNVNNFSQKKYRESHDVRVAAAENAIKGATPKNETTEKFFAEQATHQAKQLMDIFPSQPMAVSVYATPKGGTNRIDKYSGSVQVSNHTFEITDTSVKAIIFDRHKNENQKQLEVLNSRLSKDNPVNYTDFRDWLVNGKKPQQVEWRVKMEPKFVEARAMIQGNLCANKTELILYPTLEWQDVQVTQLDSTMGTSTTTDMAEVQTRKFDLGINPVAVASKIRDTEDWQSSRPGENGGTNDARWGGNNPNGSNGWRGGPNNGGGTVPGIGVEKLETTGRVSPAAKIPSLGGAILWATDALREATGSDKKPKSPETPEAPNK